MENTRKKFENAASSLFQRLDPPSTPICHEKEAFQKRSSNWKNVKLPAFRSRVD